MDCNKVAASTTNPDACIKTNLLQIDDHTKGLQVDIHRSLFSQRNSNWYQQLITNVQWHRVKYKSNRFQKECETPCWTAFYGGREEYTPYTPIPSWFRPLIEQVTNHLGNGVRFNAFLLRLYFDGDDEIAWHTDGRSFLGDEPTIASLSLGCKATFQLRRMNNVWPSQSTENCVDTTTPIESFVLSDGDLLVMRGKTQQHWHHRVPKEKGRGVRLNINFRYIMPGADAERGQKTYYKYMVHGDNNEPPSWSFDEIMVKRGGIMNFVQRGFKRKAAVKTKDDKQSAAKRKGGEEIKISLNDDDDDDDDNDNGDQTVHSATANATAAESTKPYAASAMHMPLSGDKSNLTESIGDTQQYLASNESVDVGVFSSLPIEIQNELVSQWKSSRQANVSSTTTSLVTPSTIRKKKGSAVKSTNDKKKKKCKSDTKKKGTLHSFFGK